MPTAAENRSSGSSATQADESAARARRWTAYLPLVVIVALTVLAASARQWAGPPGWDFTEWMHDFMGFFLVVFSMFKFFDLEGFADGFQKYDLLAKPFRPYAFAYPFIELALGLGFLSQWRQHMVAGVTIVIMSFGALGVIGALRKKMDVDCACLGTVLRVPLSTVALVEDLGMVAMAALMLWTEA